MDQSAENLLLTILAQMPFVLLMYMLYRSERDERVKAHTAQVEHLETTLAKNEERYRTSYENACKLYEKQLDTTVEQLKSERASRARREALKTDNLGIDRGDHPTNPKLSSGL